MPDYLSLVIEMLGPSFEADRAGDFWSPLEERVGVSLPDDFKLLMDHYAPVLLNGHLQLMHPESADWDLMNEIEETTGIFSQYDFSEELAELFGENHPQFGGPGGLIAIAGTDREERLFFLKSANEWSIVVYNGGGRNSFHQYNMTFSEWLYRYLTGEEVAGPGSSAFYPGPVRFERLPVEPGGQIETWFGPDRGI